MDIEPLTPPVSTAGKQGLWEWMSCLSNSIDFAARVGDQPALARLLIEGEHRIGIVYGHAGAWRVRVGPVSCGPFENFAAAEEAARLQVHEATGAQAFKALAAVLGTAEQAAAYFTVHGFTGATVHGEQFDFGEEIPPL